MKLSQFKFKLPEAQVALEPAFRAFEKSLHQVKGMIWEVYCRIKSRISLFFPVKTTISSLSSSFSSGFKDARHFPAVSGRSDIKREIESCKNN